MTVKIGDRVQVKGRIGVVWGISDGSAHWTIPAGHVVLMMQDTHRIKSVKPTDIQVVR